MAKTLNTRIQHKIDTTENWAKATTFKPLKGELIVYDDNNGQPPKFKIGNGVDLVGSLPFTTAANIDTNTTYDLAASKSSTNGNVKLNLTAGGSGSGTDSITVKGTGGTTVTTDANGVVTINSSTADTNTTYDLGASGTTNGAVKINLTAGGSGSGTDSIAINGTGGTTVTASGNTITINSATTSGGPSLSSSTPKVASGTGAAGESSEASRADHVHPVQTSVSGSSGSCTGNAATATKFNNFQSITLTGDVIGTASSQAGWSISTTLADTKVTAGSYGPSSDVSPGAGGTFTVPSITVDAQGRITRAINKVITLPSSSSSGGDSGGGGGDTTPKIYPPTLSGTGEDHKMGITPSSEGVTPDYYVLSITGRDSHDLTPEDVTSYFTVDLWDLTDSENVGPDTFEIKVKAVSGTYGESAESVAYGYTNYVVPSTTYSIKYTANTKVPYEYIPSHTVTRNLAVHDQKNMTWAPEGYSVTTDTTGKKIVIKYGDKTTTFGTSSGTIKIRYIWVNASAAGQHECWVVESVDITPEECLVAGTQILMADGSSKNIEDVKQGDMLKSWDIITKTPIDVVCTASMYTGRDVSVDTMKFKGGKYLQICRAHAIYNSRVHTNYTNKKWQVGDAGKGIDGEEIILENQSTAIHDTPVKHYTLHTENGLYYANGILCGHHIERAAKDIREQMDKLGYTEEEVQAIEAEALINYKEHMWSTDEAYIAMMATKPKTDDLRKQIQDAKDSLTARDYKTIKRLQGFIDDAEWEENISICQGLRDIVNNATKELEDTIAFSRQARVSLGYPEKIRSRGQQFRASQMVLNPIIRSHREREAQQSTN